MNEGPETRDQRPGLRFALCAAVYAVLAVPAGAQVPLSPEVVNTIDAIAGKNDRWLMIAWMGLCVLAFYFFSRWVMKQIEAKDGMIRELGVELGKVRDEHNQYVRTSAEKFAGIVAENTKAFQAFAAALESTPPTPLNLRPN